jgi:glycosyltransferase A (GT-A) superfamily protein (DUF2064 family)
VTRLLVVAKAPVPGEVKTRLGTEIGMVDAASVAAAALLDTLTACAETVGAARCHLALAGDLGEAVRGEEIGRLLDGWSVRPQVGAGLAARLAQAHLALGPGPVVQIGMDTPQVTPALLAEVAAALTGHPAVLGPAEDGGWWALGLRDPACARVLHGVPMSTPGTYSATRAALLTSGVPVGEAATLRDVDTGADAERVAAVVPDSEFARAWAQVGSAVG